MGLPPQGYDPEADHGGVVVPRASKFVGTKSESKRETNHSRTSLVPNANDSVFARIAYHPIFVNATLTVIVFNAFWIAIDTEWNNEQLRENGKLPLQPISDIVEHTFCAYFSIELTIRFLAFKNKLYCIFDAWFVFDSFLVLFMVIETWIIGEIVYLIDGGGDGGGALASFSVFRLLRLLRLTRMVRIMRAVPELLTLVKGIGKAVRAVSFILGFLIIIIYVFAIIFTAQLGEWYAPEHKQLKYWEDPDEPDPKAIQLFGSIFDSMMTLFTRGVLGDNLLETLDAILYRAGMCPEQDANGIGASSRLFIPPSQDDCEREMHGSVLLFWVFIMFFVITALTLLNMLIGVLCEVISESSRQEVESSQIKELDSHMRQAFAMIDSSEDGLITRAEWGKMREDKNFKSSMVNLGVEEQHMDERLEQMQESLFGDLDRDPDFGPDDVLPMSRATVGSTTGRIGLSLERFIEKVVEIRPDAPASALDIEMLRMTVVDSQSAFKKKLDWIEGVLGKFLVDEPTASDEKAAPVVKEQALITRNAADQKADDWLREQPIEVLYSVLKSRQPPELGPAKVLTDNGGCNSNIR